MDSELEVHEVFGSGMHEGQHQGRGHGIAGGEAPGAEASPPSREPALVADPVDGEQPQQEPQEPVTQHPCGRLRAQEEHVAHEDVTGVGHALRAIQDQRHADPPHGHDVSDHGRDGDAAPPGTHTPLHL